MVREDLLASSEFKKVYWSSDKLKNRRKALRGDPEVFIWPYPSIGGTVSRPVVNWTWRQVNHMVSKLTRVPVRINTSLRSPSPDPQVRLRLAAIKHRLEDLAQESGWKRSRRVLAEDAATFGYGIRAVGLEFSGPKPRVRTWRVGPEEWHQDPSSDTAMPLETASWCAWRRYVPRQKVQASLERAGLTDAASLSRDLADDSRDPGVALPDDVILMRNQRDAVSPYMPEHPTLVTDYYRRDPTFDVYYQCSSCGDTATMTPIKHQGETFPLFQCQHCGKREKKPPDIQSMQQGLRYPYGRHIRIFGRSHIDYDGPNMLELEDVLPFTAMTWYDGEYYPGYSAIELANAPQILNNVAIAMLSDNAVFNTHPKRQILKDGLAKPDNNNPAEIMEVTQEAWAAGGVKQLPPGQAGEAAKILLEQSVHSMYAVLGNDPVAMGSQPDTVRSGVGIARVIAASEVGLYTIQDNLYASESRFFRMLRDIARMIDAPRTISVQDRSAGKTTGFPYNRFMMQPDVQVEVVSDNEIDQQREELFSRAMELKQTGDPNVTWTMLEDLSGIPADVWQRAHDEAQDQQPPVMPGMPPGAPGAPGPAGAAPGSMPAARPGMPAMPSGPSGNGSTGIPNAVLARAGGHAPTQLRPPSRSRTVPTPSPSGGGM
jgi:hypothetical protein